MQTPNYIANNWLYRFWIVFGFIAVLFSAAAGAANPAAFIFTIGFSMMLGRLIVMRSKYLKGDKQKKRCSQCGRTS